MRAASHYQAREWAVPEPRCPLLPGEPFQLNPAPVSNLKGFFISAQALHIVCFMITSIDFSRRASPRKGLLPGRDQSPAPFLTGRHLQSAVDSWEGDGGLLTVAVAGTASQATSQHQNHWAHLVQFLEVFWPGSARELEVMGRT